MSGRGIFAIAEALTRDDVPSPLAHDRRRNPHRRGVAWSKGAVRTMLVNPRCTGRQVWNKQRKDEVLIDVDVDVDVDDVALGHVSRMRHNDAAVWVWSGDVVHEPLIDTDMFERVQQVMAAKGRGPEHSRAASHPAPVCAAGFAALRVVWSADARPAEQGSALLPLWRHRVQRQDREGRVRRRVSPRTDWRAPHTRPRQAYRVHVPASMWSTRSATAPSAQGDMTMSALSRTDGWPSPTAAPRPAARSMSRSFGLSPMAATRCRGIPLRAARKRSAAPLPACRGSTSR
ncbi:hypothetical protein BLA60_15005 [Actinophytocola xinjiangensis]|uniref:Recombinase domain-containing protein n=1 Tax=Actinophytocola xinjiangensis TaxID=485602 RepID=A0A7Z0WNM1_9PSEU|nr:hypothetical protein BLA60_15005 [Actinophytocola xinjiangensis]